jgi:predicted nucleic acid-binding protein
MRFVLDNSVAMRWLFADGSEADLAYAAHILELLEQEEGEAAVPALWPLEVGNVIVRAEAKGLVQEARSTEFLGLLGDMAIAVDDHTAAHALHDTMQLARRFRLSTYDASYLELALREGLPLATLDADLRSALTTTGGRLA